MSDLRASLDSVLSAIDDARRDLQIAAEYKGMASADESARGLIAARIDIERMWKFWRRAATSQPAEDPTP